MRMEVIENPLRSRRQVRRGRRDLNRTLRHVRRVRALEAYRAGFRTPGGRVGGRRFWFW